MALSSIELQSCSSDKNPMIVDCCSQEDDTQYNKISDDAIDTVETTSTGVIDTTRINNLTVTVTTTDAPKSLMGSNKFSIKKYSSHICLAFVMLFVITILLTPIILYSTLPPRQGSFLDSVDFQSCSVSMHSYIMNDMLNKNVLAVK